MRHKSQGRDREEEEHSGNQSPHSSDPNYTVRYCSIYVVLFKVQFYAEK